MEFRENERVQFVGQRHGKKQWLNGHIVKRSPTGKTYTVALDSGKTVQVRWENLVTKE
jgi:hypothetical protein